MCARSAKLDNNTELTKFTQDLEAAVIKTVENGFMTKDLAICVHGWRCGAACLVLSIISCCVLFYAHTYACVRVCVPFRFCFGHHGVAVAAVDRTSSHHDDRTPSSSSSSSTTTSVAPDKYLVTDKFLDKIKETFDTLRAPDRELH